MVAPKTHQLTRRKFLAVTSRTLRLTALALLIGCQQRQSSVNAQSTGAASWRKLMPLSELPPPRVNHAMIYDAKQERVVVFGGRGDGGLLNDVWAYSLIDHLWGNLTPSGDAPAPRLTPTAVYDPKENRMVIYSGQGAGFFNDTWALDLTTNRWEELKGELRPAARYGTVLVYDSKRHGALTFAGFTSEGGRYDDTWIFSFDTDRWQDLGPDGPRPGRRCLHMGTYDPDKDRFMIYGGQRSGPLDDLWAFDVETRTWHDLTPASKPAARMFATLVYDTGKKRLIVFGGRGAEVFGDVWAFDTQQERWMELAVSGDAPTKRHSHSAVWVPGRGMYAFGGTDANPMNDLWELSFG